MLRPEYRPAPPVALGLALLLLAAKAASWRDPWVPHAAIGISLLFGGGGLALTLWRNRLVWTGIAAFGLAGPALIVRALRPELLEWSAWGALMAALALGAGLAGLGEPQGRRRAAAEPLPC